jgi:VanZ family protein
MTRPSLRLLFLALAITWAGIIFYLSSQPGIDTPTLFPGQDKLFHMTAFGVLGFLFMGAMEAGIEGYRPRQVWLVALLVAVYGLLDEVHQYFVPGRNADVYDVFADVAGGLLGVWSMFFLVRVLARRNPTIPFTN